MGFSANLGPSVVEGILEVDAKTAGMSAAEVETWKEDQRQSLVKVSGSEEAAADRVKLARQIIEAGDGAFGKTVKGKADLYLADAATVVYLTLQAERLVHRMKLKG